MKLFIDMDGVLVDFIKQVEKYNFFVENKSDGINWERIIAAGPKFWAEMEWMPGAKEAFKKLKAFSKEGLFELYILSSIDFKEGFVGKKEWIVSKAGFPVEKAIFVINPEDKANFASEDAFLIDDRDVCLLPFQKAGGKIIKYTNWEDCLNQINEKILNA